MWWGCWQCVDNTCLGVKGHSSVAVLPQENPPRVQTLHGCYFRYHQLVLAGLPADADLQRGAVLFALVGQALVPELVKSVGGVRDELAEEDLLVRVERVDDQRHKLVDLSLEGERLSLLGHG